MNVLANVPQQKTNFAFDLANKNRTKQIFGLKSCEMYSTVDKDDYIQLISNHFYKNKLRLIFKHKVIIVRLKN